jgi:hypothetical protein
MQLPSRSDRGLSLSNCGLSLSKALRQAQGPATGSGPSNRLRAQQQAQGQGQAQGPATGSGPRDKPRAQRRFIAD